MTERTTKYAFPLPPSTQVTKEYSNLTNCEQYTASNFKPTKRTFKRVPSAQENEWALKRILKQYWGFDDFRERQLEICIEVMKGNDVFVNAPTGLGKSVCFQVPAVTVEHGITLVIVPLIALMHDQIDSLHDRGIPAACLSSSTPPDRAQAIRKQLAMCHPQMRLLYITPETLFGGKYAADLSRCHRQKQLVRMVVDEAHVIDDWGWGFRPEFRQLGKFRQMFPDVPISAFTASARSETRQDICDVLGFKTGQYAQFVFPVNRKNLFYEVKHRGNEEESERIQSVIQTIKNVRSETVSRGRPPGVGIVYCSYVKTCEDVCHDLRRAGISAGWFHAQMSDDKKTAVQEAFKHGQIECVVATIAFGMGIDKADVRYVIHFQAPAGIESYYQETGRAGRDGHMARCILYYSREDARSRRSMVNKNATMAERRPGTDAEKEAAINFARRHTNSFKFYAEATKTCRHVAVARYFEESNIDETNAQHLEAYCNKMCDICVNVAAVYRRATNITEDAPVASQMVLAKKRSAPAITQAPLSSSSRLPSSLLEVNGSDLVPRSSPSIHSSLSVARPVVPTPRTGPSVRASNAGPESPISIQSSIAPPRSMTKTSRASSGRLDSQSHPATPQDDIAAARSMATISKTAMMVQDNVPAARPAATSSPAETRVEVLDPASKTPGSVGSSLFISRPTAPLPRARPSMLAASAASSFAPSPIRAVHPNHEPQTPTVARPVDRKGKGPISIQDIVEGSYAVPDEPPSSKKKRKQQHDKFMATEAVQGDGPYGYYGASPSTSTRPRTQVRAEAFKTPFIKEKERSGNMTILADRRTKGLGRLVENLKALMMPGELADQVWAHIGRDVTESKGRRRKILNGIAQSYESDLVQKCGTQAEYERHLGLAEKVLKMLSTAKGVDVLTSGELQEDHGEREEVKVLFDLCQRIKNQGQTHVRS